MTACLNCGGVIPCQKRRDAVYCSELCGNRKRNRYFATRHGEAIRTARHALRSEHKIRDILARTKHRAKRLGVPFDLTADDIVVPDFCPVLGIRLVFGYGRKGFFPNAPSIDRFDRDKGYIASNIYIISARANILKSDATLSELEQVVDYIKRGGA